MRSIVVKGTRHVKPVGDRNLLAQHLQGVHTRNDNATQPATKMCPVCVPLKELNQVTDQKLPETVLLEHGTIRGLISRITGGSACVRVAKVRH